MDSFRDDNQGEALQSSEPHVVVACPSCRTKFAVEGSLVASFETPRFHCSRCDAVFELAESTQPHRSAVQSSGDRRWVLAEEAAAASQGNHTRAHSAAQPTLKATDFSLGSAPSADVAPQTPFALFPPHNERPGLSLLGLSKSPTHTATPPEQHHAEPIGFVRRTPPVSVEEVSQSIASDPFSLFDDPTAPVAPSSTAAPVPPRPLTPPPVTKSSPVGERTAAPAPAATAPTTPRNLDASDPRQAPAPRAMPNGGRALKSTLSRLSIRTRSLTYLSAPIVVLLGLLATIGYSAYFTPRTLDAVLQAVTPSFISGSSSRLPPSELSVQDISLEFVKTQSREGLGVVHGVVYNGSSNPLDDVRLEALGFDDRGQIVVRAQAPLRSALAREKVSDLSLATVRKFQESLSASSSKIAAGERVAFAIALLNAKDSQEFQSSVPVDLSQVRYFSARVFSVGE